jgi:hypothetical protein
MTDKGREGPYIVEDDNGWRVRGAGTGIDTEPMTEEMADWWCGRLNAAYAAGRESVAGHRDTCRPWDSDGALRAPDGMSLWASDCDDSGCPHYGTHKHEVAGQAVARYDCPLCFWSIPFQADIGIDPVAVHRQWNRLCEGEPRALYAATPPAAGPFVCGTCGSGQCEGTHKVDEPAAGLVEAVRRLLAVADRGAWATENLRDMAAAIEAVRAELDAGKGEGDA